MRWPGQRTPLLPAAPKEPVSQGAEGTAREGRAEEDKEGEASHDRKDRETEGDEGRS